VISTEDQETRDILADLQAEIRRHRSTLGVASQPEMDQLGNVRSHQIVNSHLPMGWPVMPKGLTPKIIGYAQKISRRLLRWYIKPLVVVGGRRKIRLWPRWRRNSSAIQN